MRNLKISHQLLGMVALLTLAFVSITYYQVRSSAGAIYADISAFKATVDEVKQWYVDKLKMSPVDATEHVLQITDTTDRPDPDVQIGALISGRCDVTFTLVPIKRVEG